MQPRERSRGGVSRPPCGWPGAGPETHGLLGRTLPHLIAGVGYLPWRSVLLASAAAGSVEIAMFLTMRIGGVLLVSGVCGGPPRPSRRRRPADGDDGESEPDRCLGGDGGSHVTLVGDFTEGGREDPGARDHGGAPHRAEGVRLPPARARAPRRCPRDARTARRRRIHRTIAVNQAAALLPSRIVAYGSRAQPDFGARSSGLPLQHERHSRAGCQEVFMLRLPCDHARRSART